MIKVPKKTFGSRSKKLDEKDKKKKNVENQLQSLLRFMQTQKVFFVEKDTIKEIK